MYRSRKSLKALLVFVLTIVLLSNAILPMTVKGSGSDANVDYQYYYVKSGDTLTRIAKNYGVTISDIMTANNMSNADKIVTGKVIKVPLSSSGSSRSLVNSRISLNLVNANVVDVLSAIAINAHYTIIYASESADISKDTVTVQLPEMTCLKALDYVTRLRNLTYLKDGNTIIVGTPEALNSTFIDKVVMSKFTLKYITAEALQSQASTLGLSNVQYVTTPQNPSVVYISAYPKELAKIKELISILDVSSNIMSGSKLITSNFTSIDLDNITASEFSGLLTNLGLDAGIVLASRPYTLYTFVTGSALADIRAIKNIVDRPLSGNNLAAVQGSAGNGAAPEEQDKVVTTAPPQTTAPSNNNNTQNTPSGDTQQNLILREVNLNFITRVSAEDICESFQCGVKYYGPKKMTKKIWLCGTEAQVNDAESRINQFDNEEYAENYKLENQFFVYQLQNITYQELYDRLQEMNLGLSDEDKEKATFKPLGIPSLTHSIMVVCNYHRQEEIKNFLVAVDTASTGELQNRAIETTVSSAAGRARIAALRSIHPEIPGEENFTYLLKPDKDGTGSSYVTYLNSSADMAVYVKGLLKEMDETP